jgi:hypothetical protein
MLAVQVRPGGHFGLVEGFLPVQAIPPCPAAVQVGANLRCADGFHRVQNKFSTLFVGKLRFVAQNAKFEPPRRQEREVF